MVVPLDTWTPGRHTFTVSATDHAGNASTKSASISSAPASRRAATASARIGSVRRHLSDSISGPTRRPLRSPFTAGVRPGMVEKPAINYLRTDSTLAMPNLPGVNGRPLAEATGCVLCVTLGTNDHREPRSTASRVSRRHMRWAFNHTTGFNWVNTGMRPVAVGPCRGDVRLRSRQHIPQRSARAHTGVQRRVSTAPVRGSQRSAGSPEVHGAFRWRDGRAEIFSRCCPPRKSRAWLLRETAAPASVQTNLTVQAPRSDVFRNGDAAIASTHDGLIGH